jgi:hypothetical protein
LKTNEKLESLSFYLFKLTAITSADFEHNLINFGQYLTYIYLDQPINFSLEFAAKLIIIKPKLQYLYLNSTNNGRIVYENNITHKTQIELAWFDKTYNNEIYAFFCTNGLLFDSILLNCCINDDILRIISIKHKYLLLFYLTDAYQFEYTFDGLYNFLHITKIIEIEFNVVNSLSNENFLTLFSLTQHMTRLKFNYMIEINTDTIKQILQQNTQIIKFECTNCCLVDSNKIRLFWLYLPGGGRSFDDLFLRCES